MIKNIEITAGYPKKLPALKKKVNFSPSLNILFGPNGCGKSTLIQTLAAYTGVNKQGWSGFVSPIAGFRFRDENLPYPDIFKAIAPGDCEARVEWDGYPTFCFDGVAVGKQPLSVADLGDSFVNILEGMEEMLFKPSIGLQVITRINRIPKILENVPDITQHSQEYKNCNDFRRDSEDAFIKYVKSLRSRESSKVVTILLDEIDRSLSIPNQQVLWGKFIPDLAKYYQVIAATHSPFALFQEIANYIEMEKGYIKACREALHDVGLGLYKK